MTSEDVTNGGCPPAAGNPGRPSLRDGPGTGDEDERYVTDDAGLDRGGEAVGLVQAELLAEGADLVVKKRPQVLFPLLEGLRLRHQSSFSKGVGRSSTCSGESLTAAPSHWPTRRPLTSRLSLRFIATTQAD